MGEEGNRTWGAGAFNVVVPWEEEGESKLENDADWNTAGDKGKAVGRLRIGLIVREPWKITTRAGDGRRTA